jgi:hypothetical protein
MSRTALPSGGAPELFTATPCALAEKQKDSNKNMLTEFLISMVFLAIGEIEYLFCKTQVLGSCRKHRNGGKCELTVFREEECKLKFKLNLKCKLNRKRKPKLKLKSKSKWSEATWVRQAHHKSRTER